MRLTNYINEAEDLRKDYDEKAVIKAKSDKSTGTLYRKGNIVQMWWKSDSLGRSANRPETWTMPDEKQAKESFKNNKKDFSE